MWWAFEKPGRSGPHSPATSVCARSSSQCAPPLLERPLLTPACRSVFGFNLLTFEGRSVLSGEGMRAMQEGRRSRTGPGLVLHRATSWLANVDVVETLTPLSPLMHRWTSVLSGAWPLAVLLVRGGRTDGQPTPSPEFARQGRLGAVPRLFCNEQQAGDKDDGAHGKWFASFYSPHGTRFRAGYDW
jgi:hypothetical protein